MPKIIIKLSQDSLNKINTFINTLDYDEYLKGDSFKANLIEYYKEEYKKIRYISEQVFIKCYLLSTEYALSSFDLEALVDLDNNLTNTFKDEVSKIGREYIITNQNNNSFDNTIDYWFNEVNKELIRTLDFDNDDFDIIPENRDTFIRKNLRLVVNCAKRYRYVGIPFEDLIQTGNVGLINAYDHYDSSRSKVRKKITELINSTADHCWTFDESYEVVNNNIKYTNNITKIIFDKIPDDGFKNNQEFIDWCNVNIKAASLPSLAFLMIRAEILVSLSSSRQVNIPYNKLAKGFTNFISLDQKNPKDDMVTTNSLMFDKSKEEFFIDNTTNISTEEQDTLHYLLEKYLSNLEPEDKYILTEYYGLNTDEKVDNNILASKLGMTIKQLNKYVENICKKIFSKINKTERDYINELI